MKSPDKIVLNSNSSRRNQICEIH